MFISRNRAYTFSFSTVGKISPNKRQDVVQGTQCRKIHRTRNGPVGVRRTARPIGASNGLHGRSFTSQCIFDHPM